MLKIVLLTVCSVPKKDTAKAFETTFWMSKSWRRVLGHPPEGAGQGYSFLCGEALVTDPPTPCWDGGEGGVGAGGVCSALWEGVDCVPGKS